ncbi:helix-turn-helix domain-containing protein [Pseudomonas typographi]|uniref:helix-turn-helix domain-containing protein n=1 Tax=Pseudomonas typographi TaxID=2715964 RepID=UPI001EEE56D7|nr:helix-turn-helix domain-containing protein [Pseudomonas typographi]
MQIFIEARTMTVQEMLSRLFQLGLSQAEIAESCDTTQPTISRAANGAMVRYELGKAIETLLSKRARAAKRSENQAA